MRGHIPNLSLLTRPLSSRVNEAIASRPIEEMKAAFAVVQDAVKKTEETSVSSAFLAVREQINLVHLRYDQTMVWMVLGHQNILWGHNFLHTLAHVPGEENDLADAISRAPLTGRVIT